MNLASALDVAPVIAIVRERAGRRDLAAVVDALVEGGVRAVEVTVDTPGWEEVLAARPEEPGVVLGAGTVQTIAQVDRLVDAGGRFIVSPHLDVELVEYAIGRGLTPVPGTLTGTEIDRARRSGAPLVKLFPAGPLGRDYLRALRGPFAGVGFVPTGGIALDDAADWLAAGAIAVGLGSALTTGSPSEIERRARQVVKRCVPR